MKNILLIVCLLLGTISAHAGNNTICDRIYKQMGNKIDSMTIKMADLLPMQWDTMFIFYPLQYGRPQHQEDEVAVSDPYFVEIHTDDQFYYTPETAVFLVTKEVHPRKEKYFTLRSVNSKTTDIN